MARAAGRHKGSPLRGGPLMTGIILATFAGDPGIRADEIRMHNGDRLTGRVIRQDGGVLKLQTDYAGTLEIAWAEVREVKLEEPIDMVMSDDRLLTVTEIVRDADRLRVQPSPPVTQSMEVDPERVEVIAPKDWEIGRGYRLGGELNASLTSGRGNSHTNDVYIDYRLDYRRQRSRLESYGQLEYEQRFWNDRIELYHRQLSFTAVNGTGEDLLLTWTGVSVPLDGGFVGALEYQIEYDSKPSDQALTTDTTLLLKLGYQWQ
jgi:hypothetical protein